MVTQDGTGTPRTGQDQGQRPPDPPPARVNGSLAGNLVFDPELRYTSAGRPCCSLRLAVTRRFRNEETQRWEDTETTFHDVKAWGTLGEHVVNCLQRGDRVVAKGYWTEERWTTNSGEERQRDVLVADDVGPSLVWTEVRIPRNKGERGGGQHAKNGNGGGLASRVESEREPS